MEPQQEPEIIIEKFYQKKKFWLYVFVAIIVIALVLVYIFYRPGGPEKPKIIELTEEQRAEILQQMSPPTPEDGIDLLTPEEIEEALESLSPTVEEDSEGQPKKRKIDILMELQQQQ